MISIAQALRETSARLARLPQASPRLEAELLLAEILGRPRGALIAWGEQPLTIEQSQRLDHWLERRLAGEPIAYLLGRREFWSLELQVDPRVLIPRPETELLVELALAAFPADDPIQAVDLGTGSGAIAAALARERPRWSLEATDLSQEALGLAEANFRRLGLDGRVRTHAGDWCQALPSTTRYHLMVSNPPYLRDADPHLKQGDLPREPRLALTAGTDGLDACRTLIRQAPAHLRPGGLLLLEHGFDQGEPVRCLLRAAGFREVCTHADLAGWERVGSGRWLP